MSLSPQVLTVLVLLALAIAGFALFVVVSNVPKGGRRLSQDRRAVSMLTNHEEDLSKVKAAIRQMAEDNRRIAETALGMVQRVGLVRYDAFDEMGGHLSFSAALLDGSGNGLVITSINGRQDTRVYAKPVRGWASKHNLSEEEEEAIRRALTSTQQQGPPRVRLAAQGRPRPVRGA
ncbi:MAG TPA: DUF4446 family protein [Actinomycetota bacterium]|nr:DUF4446 family protein [Actinomycetota bacterium]